MKTIRTIFFTTVRYNLVPYNLGWYRRDTLKNIIKNIFILVTFAPVKTITLNYDVNSSFLSMYKYWKKWF